MERAAEQVGFHGDGLVDLAQCFQFGGVCGTEQTIAEQDVLAAIGFLAQAFRLGETCLGIGLHVLGHQQQALIRRQAHAGELLVDPLDAVRGSGPFFFGEVGAALAEVGADDHALVDELVGLAPLLVVFLAFEAHHGGFDGIDALIEVGHASEVDILEGDGFVHLAAAVFHFAGVDLLWIGLQGNETIGDRVLPKRIVAALRTCGERLQRLVLSGLRGHGGFVVLHDAVRLADMFLPDHAQPFHLGQHVLPLLWSEFQHGGLAHELSTQAVGEHQFQSAQPIGTRLWILDGLHTRLVHFIVGIDQCDDVGLFGVGEEGGRDTFHVHPVHSQFGGAFVLCFLLRGGLQLLGGHAQINSGELGLQAIATCLVLLGGDGLLQFGFLVLQHEGVHLGGGIVRCFTGWLLAAGAVRRCRGVGSGIVHALRCTASIGVGST